MSFLDFVPFWKNKKKSAWREQVDVERAAGTGLAPSAVHPVAIDLTQAPGAREKVGVGNCGVDWSLYTEEGIDMILLGKAYRTYHSGGTRTNPNQQYMNMDYETGLPASESFLLPESHRTPGWSVALQSPIVPREEAARLLRRDADGTRFAGCDLRWILDVHGLAENLLVRALREAQEKILKGEWAVAKNLLQTPDVLASAGVSGRMSDVDDLLRKAADLEIARKPLLPEEKVEWFGRNPLREDEVVAWDELTLRLKLGCERFVERGWINPVPAVRWNDEDDGREQDGTIERCRFFPAVFKVAEERIRGTPYAKAPKSGFVGAPQEVIDKARKSAPWAFRQYQEREFVGT